MEDVGCLLGSRFRGHNRRFRQSAAYSNYDPNPIKSWAFCCQFTSKWPSRSAERFAEALWRSPARPVFNTVQHPLRVRLSSRGARGLLWYPLRRNEHETINLRHLFSVPPVSWGQSWTRGVPKPAACATSRTLIVGRDTKLGWVSRVAAKFKTRQYRRPWE